MVALLIGYESVDRIFAPVPIHFAEAIPIAALGLAVNIASVWLLSGGGHHHGHDHGHSHDGHDRDEAHAVTTTAGIIVLEVFEDGVPPRFRLRARTGPALTAQAVTIETVRPNGARQLFKMIDRETCLESAEEIPEPHEFTANLHIDGIDYPVVFEEHEHGHGNAHRDNNMRAAAIHMIADATVSVLVLVRLFLARTFGWLWMDPLAGIIGACVIASWSYGLIRDTGAILLDMNRDRAMTESVRQTIEANGDRLADLHVWRLGPGHLGAIVSVVTAGQYEPEHYHRLLARFRVLSHVTVEVHRPTA